MMTETHKRRRLLLKLIAIVLCAALGLGVWYWTQLPKDKVINLLLVGQDTRSGDEVGRSDAMILCTVNTEKKAVTFTSFQRDMYVTIPGKWQDKLNHAFRYGAYYGDGSLTDAFALLKETLESNFGVRVDGCVEVDFESFIAVIDQVGGVDMELTDKEADYLAKSGYSLSGGMNHLSGEQALAYSRIRYLDNDFVRNARQRKVLSALVEKAGSRNLFQLNDLLQTLRPMVWTDISDAEIRRYALQILPLLPELEIHTQQIPAEGTYQDGTADGMSVQIVTDFDANRRILEEIMGSEENS